MTARRMRINESLYGKAFSRAWYGQPWAESNWRPTWRREMLLSKEGRRRRDERALVVAAIVARVGTHG